MVRSARPHRGGWPDRSTIDLLEEQQRQMAAGLPELSEYPLPTMQQYLAGRAAKMPGAPAPYAVPMDRAIIQRLSRSTLQYPVDRLVDLAVQVLLSPLLLNSIPVASRSFPRLNELRVQAAETLGIPVPDL